MHVNEFDVNLLVIKEVLAFGTEDIIASKQLGDAVLNSFVISCNKVSVKRGYRGLNYRTCSTMDPVFPL